MVKKDDNGLVSTQPKSVVDKKSKNTVRLLAEHYYETGDERSAKEIRRIVLTENAKKKFREAYLKMHPERVSNPPWDR